MTIYELWEAILSSTADDWVHHEMVASMDPHTDIAAYRHDLSIGISWGETCVRPFEEPWLEHFPDRSAYSVWVDPTFNGHMVDRKALVRVDGGRCYLPLPQGMDRSTIKELDVGLARVIQGIASGNPGQVDEYLQRAGIQPPDDAIRVERLVRGAPRLPGPQ